ncbi:nucleoside triphosphate pyrophosphohydrolase family protein [Borrelia sp. RT1S]|uniref:nucleoside triphosphate pyrophosphohydrolase family protein n=1 Tax=Borrelia sp. RT1S TaxID=2898580 RepID=UPI0027961D7B|nr:MazG nucleotide pyrophosphohydrolase domain-containing protein [Borrelia sp. RT1S]
MNEYQAWASEIGRYASKREELILPMLELAEETGEVIEKIKKLVRDRNYVLDDEYLLSIKKELGDVLWYISSLGNILGVTLEDIAITNLEKLKKRHEDDTINGEGDER